MASIPTYHVLMLPHDEGFLEEVRQVVEQSKHFKLAHHAEPARIRAFIRRCHPRVILLSGNEDAMTDSLQWLTYLQGEEVVHTPYIIVTLDDEPIPNGELQSLFLRRGADFIVSKGFLLFNLPSILQMVFRHEQNLDKLQSQQQEMGSILAHQQEMICRFRPDTTLTFVNQAYAKTFGKPAKELLGTRFLDLIPKASHDGVMKLLASYNPENPSKTYRHEVKLPGGGRGWQEWTDHAFFDDKGKVSGFQSVGRDITEEVNLREALVKSDLRERQHIASELHDHIGQMLVLIKLRLEQHLSGKCDCGGKADMEAILNLLQETVREVRQVSHRMVAGFVKAGSFREALDELVDSYKQLDQLSVTFRTQYVPTNLSELAQTNLYRILQEALSNAVKHGQATHARISMYARNGTFRLSFRDNGKGMDLSFGRGKAAFRTIRYRSAILGGHIHFHSRPGRFFRFSLQVPLNNLLARPFY